MTFFLINFRIHPSDIEIREHQISHIERDCRVHIFKALFRKSFTIHPSAMARAQNAPPILECSFSHKKFTWFKPRVSWNKLELSNRKFWTWSIYLQFTTTWSYPELDNCNNKNQIVSIKPYCKPQNRHLGAPQMSLSLLV